MEGSVAIRIPIQRATMADLRRPSGLPISISCHRSRHFREGLLAFEDDNTDNICEHSGLLALRPYDRRIQSYARKTRIMWQRFE